MCLLVWLSLLSIEDLTRILPIGEKPLKNALSQLEARSLVAHVPLHEIGWSRHSRYYVTDLGLYVLVEGLDAPVSVPKLVKSYPVTRADLQARLASPIIHITLSTMISRLMAECPQGYQLTSYQQPWQECYTTLAGENHIFTCDAAFLLRTPVGDQHAFYVHIDQSERLFSAKAARRLLDSLFEMRKRYHLEGNAFPSLLLLSNLARFSFWSRLLDESPTLYGTRPLHGAIVNMSLIEQEGIYGPIWTPFDRLRTDAHRVGLSALFDIPATPALIERFSQYFTFKHLLEETPDGTRRTRQLPRFVGDSLEAEASRLSMQNYPTIAKCIADAMHTAKSERREMVASLSILLSADQKSILAFLVRHPYLCEDDLQILLYSESTDVRRLWRHLDPLVEMKLVRTLSLEGGTQRTDLTSLSINRGRAALSFHPSSTLTCLLSVSCHKGGRPAQSLSTCVRCYLDATWREALTEAIGPYQWTLFLHAFHLCSSKRYVYHRLLEKCTRGCALVS